MSLARTGVLFAEELARTFRRLLFWFLIGLLVLMSWGSGRVSPAFSGCMLGPCAAAGSAIAQKKFNGRLAFPPRRHHKS